MVLALFALVAVWSMLIFQLSTTWRLTEQYSHGYLVPILCLFLLVRSPFVNSLDKVSDNQLFKGKLWLYLGTPIILTLPFIWIIREANPDWRLLNLIFYIIVMLITVIPFYDTGGFKNVRPLVFPLIFFAVSIPWPLYYDLRLTQYFQEKISSIIVDILLILEHEASLQGTVIDVGVFGQIGIDQACSGINGLQSSIVVSLFLGAYFKFKTFNRISLLVGGILVAIGCNLVRAFSMSFVKVKGKGHLLDNPLFSIRDWNFPSLHDLAGWIETFLILILIYALAKSSKIGFQSRSLGDEPNNWSIFKIYPNIAFSTLTLLLVILSLGISKYHFERTEAKMVELPKLKIELDENLNYSEEQHISAQIASQLHFTKANSIQWQDRLKTRTNPYNQEISINPNQEYWQLFEATWNSGGACTSVLSTHSPDSCLPLQGFSQINPLPGKKPSNVSIKLGDFKILFEYYEFIKKTKKIFRISLFLAVSKIPETSK